MKQVVDAKHWLEIPTFLQENESMVIQLETKFIDDQVMIMVWYILMNTQRVCILQNVKRSFKDKFQKFLRNLSKSLNLRTFINVNRLFKD